MTPPGTAGEQPDAEITSDLNSDYASRFAGRDTVPVDEIEGRSGELIKGLIELLNDDALDERKKVTEDVEAK